MGKRRLSDIGRQFGVKVRKEREIDHAVQSYDEQEISKDDEDSFASTSLYKTGHNLRSNDFEQGQELKVFTKAVIHVKPKQRLPQSSGLSVINYRDIKSTKDSNVQNAYTKLNTKVFLRDDSGYQSDDYSGSASDSSESSAPAYYGDNSEIDCVEEKMVNYGPQQYSSESENFNANAKNNIYSDKASFKNIQRPLCEDNEEDSDIDLDESDVIIPNDCIDTIADKRPKLIDRRWARKSLDSDIEKQLFKHGTLERRKSLPEKLFGRKCIEPTQKTLIYIPHKYADKAIGDEFGAEIWTYQTKQRDGTIYYQHFMVDIKSAGPAAKMKIHDNDEIVLLNSIFVPNLTHKDVLNLFRHVKVDGQTKFKLVVRRIEKVRSKKEWLWVEISAILAPDCRQDPDTYPEVEHLRLRKLPGNEYESKSFHYYKVRGTQYYLDIQRDSVVANVMTNTFADQTKMIFRIAICKYNMHTQKLDFTAALYSKPVSKYIVMDHEKNVKLDDSPVWFEMETIHPDIMFKVNGVYLACNSETHTIEGHESEYKFEEVPADTGIDHPDHSMQCDALNSGEKSRDSSPKLMSCDSKLTPCGTSRLMSCDSEQMSCDSSQMQCDSSQMSCDDKSQIRDSTGPVTDDSKTFAKPADMRLDIPETRLYNGRRSSEILKTPTTPFGKMFIVS